MPGRFARVIVPSLLALVVLTAPASMLARGANEQATPVTLGTVLQRAATYATDFKRRLSGIVTEEIYVQDVDAYTKFKPEVTHRELKSDLLLVQAADVNRYVEFRDVAEVDGRAVRDRQDRLTSLFLNPSGASAQMARILEESARYNIGKVRRNVNTPLLALFFLDPQYQSHFTFSVSNDPRPTLSMRGNKGDDLFAVSPDLCVVEYQESRSPTIIRSPEGREMPAHGRFWLDPTDGRLLITELIAGDGSLRATINVSYQLRQLLGFSVPAQMRERYDSPDLVISGTATYGNFRSFNVKVQEDQRPPDR